MRLARRDLLGLALAGGLAGRARAAEKAADVRRYGARGDGAADDAAAIQAAIDSAAPLLLFPPGRYLVGRSLVPRSGQHWRGEGASVSILCQPDREPPPPFNLVERRDGLAAAGFQALGFAGNGSLQTRPAPDGQRGFALYLRGAVAGIEVRSCRFAGFGDGKDGGGGAVIGPAPGDAEQGLDDIAVADCRFENNGNVAGLYLCGGDRPGAARRGVRIAGNRFGGVMAGRRVQNCLYVLGAAGAPIEGVAIAGNIFELATPADACIELNWTEGFTVTGNEIAIRAAMPGSSAILLRDGCRNGSVAVNTLSERSGGRVGGILLLNFADPGRVENVAVSANSLDGFAWRAVAVDRGSRGILVGGNRIAGRTAEAIRIAGASDTLVEGNVVSGAVHPVVIAGQGPSRVAALTVRGNEFTGCGGEPGLIDAAAAPDLDGLVVRGNRVRAPLAGTTALVGGLAGRSRAVIAENLMAGLSAREAR